jgi:hypothetical protein
MRLHDFLQEGKRFLYSNYLMVLILPIIFSSYGMGYLSAKETLRIPIYIEKYSQQGEMLPEEDDVKHIVASKSGTKVYFIWCSGVKRIKEENKVYFDTVEDALNKGYEKAKKCPGMD